MAKSNVSVEVNDHVLVIELNRPEKFNAFDLEMYRDLSLAYGELHKNPNLGAVSTFSLVPKVVAGPTRKPVQFLLRFRGKLTFSHHLHEYSTGEPG
jgi:hypothetical protein